MSPILVEDVAGFAVRKKFIVPYGIPQIQGYDAVISQKEASRLIYLSNYVKTKGVLDLVEAIAIVVKSNRQFHLDLVGKTADMSREELQAAVTAKGLDDVVSVCGPKYREEKFSALATASVFIFPTYYYNEAFPIALIEAMQFGLACITTHEGGIPDMIEDGKTGFLVNQRDVQALADRILMLLNDPALARSMGETAREVFKQNYQLSHFENNMMHVFKEIINETG
jgi:glycosyltransferase involved in cell wall biosynthesis